MKKIFYPLIFLFFANTIQAQVGINTTVPNAQLDIRSSSQATPTNTDGVLIPKVDAFPATNPTAAQQGMLVYLTTTSGTDLPGFYYWNNPTVDWIPIGNNNTNSWSISGNAGTNPPINFIGTTDNVDLVFKRGNTLAGRIGNSTTFFGRMSGSISVGANNTYIGTEAGRDNVTGQQNVFIGRRAGTFGAAGSDNILIGNGAGIFNEANQNSFVGSFSGNGTSTGANNTFMGYSSGSGNGTGSQNAFFGASAGNANSTGVGNTAVGTNSDVGANNLTNATAIGFNSMVDASNSLVLGSVNGINSATSSVNVGIGITIPQDRLHVVGNIRMVDGNQAAGRILTSDANGTATWQNASANAWGLVGNTGTNSTTNFIGTTDDADLVFKRNSIFFGRLANTNISLGREALLSNSTGSGNTAIGDNALKDNTTGFGNTSVGSFALDDATTANFNTAIGERALAFNVLGEDNTALGSFTMRTNINGSNNTTLGSLSNVSVDGLTNATAVGANASVGASNSLVLGSVNGINSATSSVNVGIGTTTPQDRLHVVGNIRMVDGNQAAGRILTSDANGTATWQNASANAWGLLGNASTNATTNFIGTTDNVDLVFRRGNVISGRLGDSNTFFGRNSGVVNTGTSNTFIGERTGIANASGSFNTFLGRLAGANGASGIENTYLGYAAGLTNTGNGNLVLGAFAAQNTTGNFNVFVGSSSGSNNTTGTRNTTIGFQSDLGAGNLTNATAIGNLAQVDASNSLVLGSITGVNGSSVSTNVGIGTTTPSRRLHVSTGVSGGTPNGNGDFVLESNGAVYEHLLAPSANETGLLFGSELTSIHAGIICNNPSNPNGFQFRTGGNTTRMVVTNAGDIGIGTATPGGQFQLSLDEGRKPGTNTWTIASDQRLKTINGTYTKGLNEILKLNPIRFNYKNVGERTFEKEVLDTEFPGFIAQEVQPLFPDAVGTDADGFLNFNIHPILIASVNAIKELNAKNESLQTENEALKTELNEQKVLLESALQRLTLLEQK